MKVSARRTIAIAATALLVAASLGEFATTAVATPTGPGSFQLSASGDALSISAVGNSLTAGHATAAADSSPSASATGAGELLPVLSGNQTATVTQAGQNQTLPQSCASPSVPSPLSTYLSSGAGCGSAQAAIDGTGLPSATSTGTVAEGSIGAGSALDTVITSASPLIGPLEQLFGTLPSIPVSGTTLSNLLTELGIAAVTTTGLATVNVGSSTGNVAATATSGTATDTSNTGTIDLLPGAGLSGAPSVSISVGQSTATATLNRTTGAGTASVSPTVVNVTTSNPVSGTTTVPVNAGGSVSVLAGTPLASTIAVGTSSVTQGQGAASAMAQGVTLDLFSGVDGGIDITLATSTASVTGAALATTPPAPPAAVTAQASPVSAPAGAATVPGVTTVHTGEPWGGALPLVGLALASGLGLVYRRRLGALVPVLAHGTRFVGAPMGAVAVAMLTRIRHLMGMDRERSGQ